MILTVYTIVNSGGGATIEIEDYTRLKNLDFAPEADITGNSIPINQFSVDILTTDDIEDASYCELKDERNKLWAAYAVKKAVRVDPSTVRLLAQSRLYMLDYVEMDEVVYQGATAATVIEACMSTISSYYTLHSSLEDIPITGYCPAQTARERLTWVCFVIGAYVQDYFADGIKIRPIDASGTLIPLERTFFMPNIKFGDWVTGLKLTAYTFTQAASEEEWRNAGNSYMFPIPWVAEEQVFTLTNPEAPASAQENVIEIDGVYLVNTANASAILSRLSQYWFNREEVTLDCVNNHSYKPGDKLIGYVDRENMVTGYATSTAFRFGKQARSTIKLIGCETKPGALLTVNYLCDNTRIGRATYTLPVGYAFEIENPYLDQSRNGHRYIYRPLTESATGTMAAGGNTVNVDYEIALDSKNGKLYVYSVDDVETRNATGVIA
ncbi:MAG: hypothetical protein J6S60_10330 [Oscillospiraceae bacterium]|nr:hypothetical protein [Oscillospiraceae bacterium]